MYGVYAWNAGATAANVLADLLALMGGATVASLSASCNKAASSVAGVASPWSLVDTASYGVIQAASLAGAGNKQARITVTTTINLTAVEAWNTGTHAAANATTAVACSLAIASAGSVKFQFCDDCLLIASSDWTAWAAVGEIKRDGPLLTDTARPNNFLLTNAGLMYLPRLKSTTAVGDTTNLSVSNASPYGALVATGTRDTADSLYIPMVPMVAYTAGVPIGETVGPMIAGGYGVSGDLMVDGAGATYQLAKYSSTIYAFKRT